MDVALLGRYYERIADHAASMARRVIYVVTGEFRKRSIGPSLDRHRLAGLHSR